MDPISQQLMMGAAGSGGPKLYVEDVFSTWLYTGNDSTQTITNGIDLSGKGGLVWIKSRSNATVNAVYDTDRGAGNLLVTNGTSAQQNPLNTLSAFTATGFGLDGNSVTTNALNYTYTSWTFRKAAKFFDVVTYVGNTNFGQRINHSLGSTPGCIIVKSLSTSDWFVYHRSLNGGTNPEQYRLLLNSTTAQAGPSATYWWNYAPTSTNFEVGSDLNVNGQVYVAYLFAHDAGGFGDSGNDSVVKCGSFTTDGSGNATVNLGWEPQFVIMKTSNTSGSWGIYDSMRGMPVGNSSVARLFANGSSAESSSTDYNVSPTSTGFIVKATGVPSYEFIYIAIRRGPMKTPTDATKVFESVARTSAGPNLFSTALAVVDMAWNRDRTSGASGIASTRLTGSRYLVPNSTAAEVTVTSGDLAYDYNYQINPYVWSPGNAEVNWLFRRAPGFFDVVAYTGNATNDRVVNHNLGVSPELIIVKSRSSAIKWYISGPVLGTGSNGYYNLSFDEFAVGDNGQFKTPVSSTEFLLGAFGGTNGSGTTYIAYLFASCPGVSKVGSYTGTGTTLNIDCGFTNGARFVLIKRTDSTGAWYVWDTARGIVSGNDPYLLLNSTAAEVTNTDYIDPLSSGFQISSTAPAAINANGGSFIYLAIA